MFKQLGHKNNFLFEYEEIALILWISSLFKAQLNIWITYFLHEKKKTILYDIKKDIEIIYKFLIYLSHRKGYNYYAFGMKNRKKRDVCLRR